MKQNGIAILMFTVLCLCSLLSNAQLDTLGLSRLPERSYDMIYEGDTVIGPSYFFDKASDTHIYSNNWDIDGDYETESVLFIATRDTPNYYFLRIVLSSDHKIRDFPFLQVDTPFLADISYLEKARFFPPPAFPRFVADHFMNYPGDDMEYELYLYLDKHSFALIPEELKKRGLNSHYILVDYENGEIVLRNFYK